MRKVKEYYCDTPKRLEMFERGEIDDSLIRRLAIYLETDLLESRGYFTTYFLKAKSGEILHKREVGEDALAKLLMAVQDYAESEVVDENGRVKKRPYKLIGVQESD